ncbi:hypothetical protein [Nostoc sp.]
MAKHLGAAGATVIVNYATSRASRKISDQSLSSSPLMTPTG